MIQLDFRSQSQTKKSDTDSTQKPLTPCDSDSATLVQTLNTFSADWHIYRQCRIYASCIQMHTVRNDAYMRHLIEHARYAYINTNAITFRILVCWQWNFPQIFFITGHIIPEIFIQIDQKLFELWSLVAAHNIFCTHLVTMKIYNNVLHTYLHNHWKFQVIWARTF